MTTVPGTYFTQEELEADLKVDKVSSWELTGSRRMNNIGYKYKNEKRQYDKALAWYLLAAKRNDSTAQNNIGVLYYNGLGVPKNYLCALKWFLKFAQQNNIGDTARSIGLLFENGYGVPVDKYKALEWYCRDKDKTDLNRLNDQGYHRYEKDKKKQLQQLRTETEVVLDSEKKKLEDKQDKSQEEMETLEQLEITYKLVDGGKYAWDDVPILLAGGKQHDIKSVNSSFKNNEEEILELKKQIQLLKQDNDTFKRQKYSNLKLQIKEKNNKPISSGNDTQSFQRGNSAVQHQIETNGSKITSLQSEIQELKRKINSLEQQVEEKDSRNISFQTENQSLKHRIYECEQQIKAKNDKINLMENKKHAYHPIPIQQMQDLNALEQEKLALERDKANTTSKMERLMASYTTLEQLLKAKESIIASLNRENQILSTVNQGSQQGANDMVETLKNLLHAKTSETELVKQNMEHLLTNEQRRIGALEEENRRLKQERNQQQEIVQISVPLNNNINPTNGDPSQHNQLDDSYNDINYESKDSDFEGDVDDINYDTPSEEEGSNNKINYDEVN